MPAPGHDGAQPPRARNPGADDDDFGCALTPMACL